MKLINKEYYTIKGKTNANNTGHLRWKKGKYQHSNQIWCTEGMHGYS